MRTFIELENETKMPLPKQFENDDVRFPERLVALYIKEYTQEGDLVFDPFAGYGTTYNLNGC